MRKILFANTKESRVSNKGRFAAFMRNYIDVHKTPYQSLGVGVRKAITRETTIFIQLNNWHLNLFVPFIVSKKVMVSRCLLIYAKPFEGASLWYDIHYARYTYYWNYLYHINSSHINTTVDTLGGNNKFHFKCLYGGTSFDFFRKWIPCWYSRSLFK